MDNTFPVNRQGSKVVMDLKRFLQCGDGSKITRGLYDELIMHCGFIAHYDLNNFRRVFHQRPEKMLEGELYPMEGLPDPVSIYQYTDGLTSREVIDGFRRLAANQW